MLKKNDVIIVSSTTYTAHTKTMLNAQIITEELASSGVKVLYLESLGLKTVPLSGKSDLYKVFRRLIDFFKLLFKGVLKPRKNIFVLSLVRLPFENIAVVKRINEWLVTYYVNKYSRKYLKPKPILWIFLPTGNFLIDRVEHSVSIYHNVDDYSEVPNVDKKYVLKQEATILKKVDLVFTVSPITYEKFSKVVNRKNLYYLNNVARFDFFNRAIKKNLPIPKDMKDIYKQGKPIVGFMGNLASYKENLELVAQVVQDTPEYNFVFIGPVGAGESSTDITRLESLNNAYLIGPRDYKTLPSYFKYWDVAIITRRLNKANAGGFPLKYFEYLSSGLPVVITSIESLRDFSSNQALGSIADTQKDFSAALKYWVEMRRTDPVKWKMLLKERLSIAKKNSWEKRIKEFDRIISKYL
jgi:glycosyltransferase involved in cell wall biosynthesis